MTNHKLQSYSGLPRANRHMHTKRTHPSSMLARRTRYGDRPFNASLNRDLANQDKKLLRHQQNIDALLSVMNL